MGATSFQQTAYGRDVHEAYQRAVDQALHEFGHDPYSGTIAATQGDLVVIDRPPRWTTERVIDAAWAYLDCVEYGHAENARAAERRDAQRFAEVVPNPRRAVQPLMDKWEGCAAVEMSPAERKAWLDRQPWPRSSNDGGKTWTVHGPKRGTRVFVFFGLAPC